jgi:hypothetical protein
MSRRLLAAAALAAACGSIALAAAPAQATLYDRFHFAFTNSVQEDVCGIDAQIDTDLRGTVVIRYVNDGRDQAFVGHGTLNGSETFTNLANGESFRIEIRTREGDLAGRHIEGDIYEFTGTTVGVERVVDGDGHLVLRDAGQFRQTYLFDTLGDGMPGGEFVGDPSESVLRGPHPLAEMDDAAFCDMVHDLIG